MSSGYSQEGFALSLGLHLSVVAVVAVLAWTKPFERKRENIFELIPLGTPGAPDRGPAAPIQFDLPDGPLTEPAPAPPRQQAPAPPRAAPTPTPPAPRQPAAQPPRATPPPARQPTPTAVPAPKPAKPAKQPQMSYEEFVKQHGRPQPRASSTTRTPAPSRPRTAPRIDTRFTTTVSGASRTAGSASGSPDADRTEVTLYLANLYDAIERAWEKPEGMELSVAVDIDIAPNGRITNVRIARSSGNSAYDESALAAVRAVGSAGPTPGGVTLLRTLRFNMKAQ